MTREVLMEMFAENKGLNFKIYTNIAEGRGINGVNYKAFTRYNYDDDRVKYLESSIKEFAKDYLVIECAKTKGFWYSNAKRKVYVPYDKIVMVDFMTDETHPLYLKSEEEV